jgi:hypothetical protein
MRYWRMQLHPNEPEQAAFYTINSLASKFIGIDFIDDMGDLTLKEELGTTPNNFKAFVHEIKKEDIVLISLHHQPFAVLTEIGEYNYIKRPVSELNIWFKHFRRFNKISYYSDAYGKLKEQHSNLVMTNTFSEASIDSKSGKLISDWKKVFIIK